MIARRAALALAWLVAGCGSHPHASTDGRVDNGPGLGDCGCDGSGSGMPDAPMSRIDAATDAMTCNTTANCPAGQWCTETAPIASTVYLRGVWAIDNNDVFAVGDGGTIIRRRCNTWTQMSSGTTQQLNAVWASATDVWAVGNTGTILRFDGTTWNAITGVTTDNLYAISGLSSTDLWVVSEAGDAFLWNGTSWTKRGVGGVLLSVSGTSDSDVWTSGEISYVRHCNATTLWTNTTAWPTLKPEGNGVTDYLAILERSATNVWVASSSGTTLEYNGSTWTAHANGNTIFYSLWARADSDMYGAGQAKIGHWNGSAWTVTTPTGLTAQQLYVAGTATDVFVVGDSATILHQD